MDETARELGSLNARMGVVEVAVTEIRSDVKTLLLSQAGHSAVLTVLRSLVPFVALGVSFVALLGVR